MIPIYEIPGSIKELFDNGENSYRIIDYNRSVGMDNIASLCYFMECVGINRENVECNDGTQAVIKHDDYDFKLVINSGGLGDFFSHGFYVTYEEGFK